MLINAYRWPVITFATIDLKQKNCKVNEIHYFTRNSNVYISSATLNDEI